MDAIEIAVLSGIVSDRHLLTLALNEGFSPELFADPVAHRLARVVLEVSMAQGTTLDRVTLAHELEERGLWGSEMERAVDVLFLTRPPTAAQLVGYLEVLKARESRRRLEAVHERIQTFLERSGSPTSHEILQFTGEVIADLYELQRRRLRKRITPVSDLLSDLVEQVRNPEVRGLLGYSIAPFERLNQVLSGLRPGFYYGLAGAPRRGKTNLVLQMASYVARNHRIPVLYYTWEQTAKVLSARLLAKELFCNPADLLSGRLERTPRLLTNLRRAEESVFQYAPYLYLIEAGRQDTLDRIKAHAYNVMQSHGTDRILICLDYLQKIPLPQPIEDDKARTDLISSQLAELSLELRAPIVAISPLDKEGCRLDEKPAEEEGPYERPTMHHSVGSGDLEYDLDVAMVLVKDWKATHELREYLESRARQEHVDPDELPKIDVINLFIDKNRDAPESESYIVQYAFFITLNTFVELGFKLEKEYRGDYRAFTKIVEMYNVLRDSGLLHAQVTSA